RPHVPHTLPQGPVRPRLSPSSPYRSPPESTRPDHQSRHQQAGPPLAGTLDPVRAATVEASVPPPTLLPPGSLILLVCESSSTPSSSRIHLLAAPRSRP